MRDDDDRWGETTRGNPTVLPYLAAALAVFTVLIVTVGMYDREWITYRLNGCRCPRWTETQGPLKGSLLIDCKGHPTRSRLLPYWLSDLFIDADAPPPPPPDPADWPVGTPPRHRGNYPPPAPEA